MEKRAIAILALAGGGAAWWALRQGGGGIYAPIDLSSVDLFGSDPGGAGGSDAGDSGGAGSADYLPALASAEDPGGGLYTKNPYSSASGKYQFTKATWTGLGGDWGADPSQAFGGLQPSEAEQDAMAAKLTAANASVLGKIGVGVSNVTLYAAHILGAGGAAKSLPGILNSDPSTPLTAFLAPSTVAKNPALGSTVGSFLDYLTRKVG